MSIENLTPKQLRRAASIKETIEELQTELNKLGGGSTTLAKTANGGEICYGELRSS
jgi:hypothetical protein